MRLANLGLRFLLELALLAALCAWGLSYDGVWELVLGLGAPITAAAIWGRFVAPKAKQRLRDPWRLALELALFLAGVAALGLRGNDVLAALFAFLVLLSEWLRIRWDQRRIA